MTINISLQDVGENLHPQITVLGVGGSGGNAVNNMINANLEGVDFLIANTDAQALQISKCPNKIQLGLNSTRGLGAGMRPDVGKQAAEEAIQEITEKLEGSHMLFIAAGMGGGTGTGAAPVIAKLVHAPKPKRPTNPIVKYIASGSNTRLRAVASTTSAATPSTGTT